MSSLTKKSPTKEEAARKQPPPPYLLLVLLLLVRLHPVPLLLLHLRLYRLPDARPLLPSLSCEGLSKIIYRRSVDAAVR